MQSKLQKGFTLIELMIVVAIVGILAAIAIPAYQDYTIRAKISEGITAADQLRSAVADFYATQGHMPASTSMGGNATATDGITAVNGAKYVSEVDYTQTSATVGNLQVKYHAIGSQVTAGMGLMYTGTGSSTSVAWGCTTTGTGTSLPAKYAPANCR